MTGITSITRDWGFNPGIVRIASTDTLATVAGANYLTAQLANIEAVNSGPFQFLVGDLVAVAAADGSEFFRFSGSNFATLIQMPGGNGSVVLPVTSGDFAVFDGSLGSIYDLGYLPSNAAKTNVVMATGAVTANHIAVYTDTAGTVGQDAATAINQGNIQAGTSGHAGALISYPGTSTEGDLQLVAVSNAGGNFNTIISNAASVGQTQTVSIPDGGTATSNFIISNSAGTQTIATGNLTVTAGNLNLTAGSVVAGSSGHAGTVASFPATSAEGELILAAVSNASGNFNTTISNASAVGQSQVVSIPDGGNATSNFIISKSAGTQHITSGSLQVDAGNLVAGISTGGTAGNLILYPATASQGALELIPVGNAGGYNTTISSVSTLGQTSVFTIPDPGASTSNIAVTGGALVSGNLPKASGTAGVLIDSGVSTVAGAAIGIPYNAIVTMTAAQVNAAYTTPFQIVAAPTASQTIMVLNAQMITEVSSAFTSGGVAQLQYGNTNHAGGTIATSATIATAEVTAASSQIFTLAPIAAATVMATASFKGLGLFFTNATQTFATGTSSTITFAVTYMVIPTT